MDKNVSMDELERIAREQLARAAETRTSPPHPDDVELAVQLLAGWWITVLHNGLSPDEVGAVVDLPGAAYDAAVAHGRRTRRRWITADSGPDYLVPDEGEQE